MASAIALSDGLGPWWKVWKRKRYMVTILAFLGFFNVYVLRVNLSVGIVAMTSKTFETLPNGTVISKGPDFDWDSKMQGLILSSFFYGYICTQLLGGWLATRVGGARIFCIGVAATSIATIITPPAVKFSVYLFIALRIIEGLFEGMTFPSVHAVWAQWAPPSERSLMVSFAFSGSNLGNVVALPLSGLLADRYGWPSIFYVTGSIGVAWCILWWMLTYDRPEDDPRISPEELKYMKETITCQTGVVIKHPWKDIFTSVPVWALIHSHFCENWGFYTMLTQLPTFMKDVLHYDIKQAGFMSSIPYLVMMIGMLVAGRVADWLITSKILSTTKVRKILNCGAFISQTIFMVSAANLMTPVGVMTCLIFAVGLGAFAWPAFSVNHLDLAPQHASVLMGISNTFATLPGIVSPILTGFIVTNKTKLEWQTVFYIASGIYLSGCLTYGLFGSGEKQIWAEKGIPPRNDEQADGDREGKKKIDEKLAYHNKAFIPVDVP